MSDRDIDSANDLVTTALRGANNDPEQAAFLLAVALGRVAERGGVPLDRVALHLSVSYGSSRAVGASG